MSSDPLRGVIVSHAAVGRALIAAVESITGVGDALFRILREAVGAGPAVLFIDLPGGSCLTGAVSYARGRPELAVVTGVNLAMLLDFVFHRDLTPPAAAERAAAAGSRAIRVPAA